MTLFYVRPVDHDHDADLTTFVHAEDAAEAARLAHAYWAGDGWIDLGEPVRWQVIAAPTSAPVGVVPWDPLLTGSVIIDLITYEEET